MKVIKQLLKLNPTTAGATQAIEFIEYLDTDEQEKIRAFGVEYYSIEKSAATYIESLNLLK